MAFNPNRLSLARRRRGLTKVMLADTADLSTRIITAYEAGEKIPGPATEARLGAVLSFPVEFFDGPDLEEPPIEGSSFRALSRLTAKLRDQALGAGALAILLSDWIAERFSLPASDIPRYQGIDPETAAAGVRSAWGLGERPARNMVHLLESHGVRVFSLTEDTLEMDAFSFWRGDEPYLFLNTMKSGERSRMDAAHELGHLVLHWKGGAHGRESEYQADEFASAFLMPRGSILAEAPRNPHLAQLIAAKQRWNVSVAALTYRMHDLKLLTDWQYRSLFIEMSRRGFRTQEPNSITGEASQVLAKVFHSLQQEGKTMSSIAADLRLFPEELTKLIFGLVLTSVAGTGGVLPLPPTGKPNFQVL